MHPERLEATLEVHELGLSFRKRHARPHNTFDLSGRDIRAWPAMAMDYRHAVYAGSFDPITLGHTAIIERASRLFARVTVAIGVNPRKKGLFEIDHRKRMITESLRHLPNVEVAHFDGLLIDFMRSIAAGVIVRGLRLMTDFEYEFQLGLANRDLAPEIETIFMLTESAHVYVSSSLVKEIAENGGDCSRYVPKVVLAELASRFPSKT
jgi:pantetheine-phosphate adenylyltransferase